MGHLRSIICTTVSKALPLEPVMSQKSTLKGRVFKFYFRTDFNLFIKNNDFSFRIGCYLKTDFNFFLLKTYSKHNL
jgi:hypothetical protein